jgi:tetratricopeptide (TPR) repeat protein
MEQRLSEYRRMLATFRPGQEGRAETLSRIADELVEDGQLDAARAAYQDVVDDGGRTILSPLAGLLDIALKQHDDARADELLGRLLAQSRADALVVGDYEWVAEALEEAGRLRQALRWFTIPLRDIQPGDLDLMPAIVLDGRWRVRRALDLPIDAYDDAHDVWHEINDAEDAATP